MPTGRGPRERQGAAFTSHGPLRKSRCLSGAASPAHRTRGLALRSPEGPLTPREEPPRRLGGCCIPGGQGRRGPGGQREGGGAAALGGPRSASPPGQGAQDAGGTPRAPTPLSSQLLGQQHSGWLPARGPPSHAGQRPETSPRASVPRQLTSVHVCQAGVNTGGEHLAGADHACSRSDTPCTQTPSPKAPMGVGSQ